MNPYLEAAVVGVAAAVVTFVAGVGVGRTTRAEALPQTPAIETDTVPLHELAVRSNRIGPHDPAIPLS